MKKSFTRQRTTFFHGFFLAKTPQNAICYLVTFSGRVSQSTLTRNPDPTQSLRLTGPFPILTGTLPVQNMHFDQCSCGSLPVLPVQPPLVAPKGGVPSCSAFRLPRLPQSMFRPQSVLLHPLSLDQCPRSTCPVPLFPLISLFFPIHRQNLRPLPLTPILSPGTLMAMTGIIQVESMRRAGGLLTEATHAGPIPNYRTVWINRTNASYQNHPDKSGQKPPPPSREVLVYQTLPSGHFIKCPDGSV